MHPLLIVPFLLVGTNALAAHNIPAGKSPLKLRQDICSGFKWDSGDAGQDADVWDKTGAGTFLGNFIHDHGVGNWTNNFFEAVISGGTQQGSTFDCGNFPTTGQCQSPGNNACSTYKPNEAFYVHIAISNFYSAYYKMHEKLQDKAIIDIASVSKSITDIYGPPPTDQGPDLFALLIGTFIFAGFIPGANVGATAMIGTLNLAAGGAKTAPGAQDPNTFQGELVDQVGKMFGILQSNIENTIKQVIGGDISDQVNGQSANDFITGQFDKGAYLDHNTLGGITDKWIEAYGGYLTDAMVVEAWKARKNQIYIKVRNPSDKNTPDTCRNQAGAVWFDNYGCAGFAWERPAPTTGAYYEYFNDDDISKAMDLISDYGAALQNAVECLQAGTKDDKGLQPSNGPDWTSFNNFDQKTPSSFYPKCFWNINRAFGIADPLPGTK